MSHTTTGETDMAEVLLFHHVQGLTPGVVAFADDLRPAGHTVHTPDLFDGRTFDDHRGGLRAHARASASATLIERGVAAAEALPDELVYAGFSLGVVPAQQLAQTRPGRPRRAPASTPASRSPGVRRSAVAGRASRCRSTAWTPTPSSSREGDLDAARALVDRRTDDAELFLYPGDQHLFADRSLPSYDADAAALLTRRVLDFLAAI